MPVTFKSRPAPPAEVDDLSNIRVRDRRPDPVGPLSKQLFATASPTPQQVKVAREEFRTGLNRMSYYMDYASWWAVCQRYNEVNIAAENKKIKDAVGLLKQLWAKYKDVMKNGIFERRWGHEPRS